MSTSIWLCVREWFQIPLTQCELAGQPSDESRVNHPHDSRSETETPTHAEQPANLFLNVVAAITYFFFGLSKKKKKKIRRWNESLLGTHRFQPTDWTGGWIFKWQTSVISSETFSSFYPLKTDKDLWNSAVSRPDGFPLEYPKRI